MLKYLNAVLILVFLVVTLGLIAPVLISSDSISVVLGFTIVFASPALAYAWARKVFNFGGKNA